MSDVVPAGLPGEGRRVVPGYMMLSAFTGMNPGNHANSFYKAWLDDIVSDNGSSKTYNFYLDYNAVLDMDARFYEQTVKWVFQEARLARGIMMMEGRPVNPRFITSPQLVVEGGKDEISPPGHTLAYLEMMGGSSKYHILNPSVGHYGAFTGSKFDKQIAPCIKAHIRQAGSGIGLLYNSIPETDTEAMKIWDGKCPPPRENTPGTGSAESPFLFPF
jgi:polyhydroxyalkanoate depolymerase